MPDPNDDISPADGVEAVAGIGPARSEDLKDAGYETVEDLQDATIAELSKVIPANVAKDTKDVVGDKVENVPDIAQAKEEAQKQPGAKAKLVRQDGKQVPKVLRRVQSQNLGGAHMEIHKG